MEVNEPGIEEEDSSSRGEIVEEVGRRACLHFFGPTRRVSIPPPHSDFDFSETVSAPHFHSFTNNDWLLLQTCRPKRLQQSARQGPLLSRKQARPAGKRRCSDSFPRHLQPNRLPHSEAFPNAAHLARSSTPSSRLLRVLRHNSHLNPVVTPSHPMRTKRMRSCHR